ncbi:hypothetical protein Pcinc_031429 [Petrolisthes cinctipes]|uniref:Uncharacterized protein n=1 Tax=Petrolisthes cinctipes TaxID=88211 RepID=A0AAE1K4J0_PETCI|nr:hypothetical protein Pcinc_031429 [Petrolisthes cinctipes]
MRGAHAEIRWATHTSSSLSPSWKHLPPRHFSPLLVKFSERMDWQLQLFADWDDEERLDAEINALAGARRRPRRIVTDRINPFTSMSADEFVDRFRLRKVSAVTLLEEVINELPAAADLRGKFSHSVH